MKEKPWSILKVAVACTVVFSVMSPVLVDGEETQRVSQHVPRPVNPPAQPAPAPMGREDFRDVMLTFVEVLDTLSAPSTGLYDAIAGLNTEEMQALYDAYEGHHHTLAESVAYLADQVLTPPTPSGGQGNPSSTPSVGGGKGA